MEEKLEKAEALLERALDFINWIKQEEGEIDDDGLENDILTFFDKK